MKSYIISFDPLYTNIDGAHQAITNSYLVTDWWHYLNGTYLVKSTAISAFNLRQNIVSRWPGGWFVILEVKGTADGLLPQEAWDWINKKI